MALTVFTKAQCPYCGHENLIMVTEDDARRPTIILCDNEGGPGCDRYFVVRIKVVATATGQAIADE